MNNKRKYLTLSVILLIAIGLLLTACQPAEETPAVEEPTTEEVVEEPTEAAVEESAESYVIGFSNASTSNSWRAFFDAWVRYEASRHPEIEELIDTDAQDDPVKQIADIEDLMAQGVDLLIISPAEQEALVPAVESAMEAGIPVILVDRKVNTDNYISYVGASDTDMGRIMAEELVKMIGEKGNIVMFSGIAGASPAELRLEAAREVFAQYPDIKIVGHTYTGWQPSEAKAAMEGFIQANEQIDGIWADSGLLSWPAEEALQEAGRDFVPATGDQFIGFSKFVYENDIPAVQVRFPATMGADAVLVALKYLQGEEVEKEILVPLVVIPSSELGKYDILDKPDDWWVGDYNDLPDEYLPDF
jgi:ribose transport system substrate-binding protein